MGKMFQKISMLPQKGGNLYYERARLTGYLDEAFEKDVVLVAAGPGYGKTLTVLSYLKNTQHTVGWFSCTPMDNYPLRFWESFARGIAGEDGKLYKKLMRIGFPDTLEKCTRAVKAISEEQDFENTHVVVVDDVHNIDDTSVIYALESIIGAQIKGLKFVLLTRNVNFNAWALYEKGSLSFITLRHLTFTLEETRDFLHKAGVEATFKEIESFYNRTEGWPMAIGLVALGKKREELQFEEAVSVSVSLISHLMEQEAFAAMPKWEQKLYVKLSLLHCIPDELLAEITTDMADELRTSFSGNMLVQYDASLREYTFHGMYSDFLRGKQYLISEPEIKTMYLTAAKWYKRHGNKIEAIAYFGKCGEQDAVWELIQTYGSSGYNEETASYLAKIIEDMPEDYVLARPLIGVYHANFLIILGKKNRARNEIIALEKEILQRPETEETKRILGEIYLSRAHVSMIMHSYNFGKYYKKAAQLLLPKGSIVLCGRQMYVGNNNALFLMSTNEGEIDKTLHLLKEVIPLASEMMGGCGHGMEKLAEAEAAYFRADIAGAETLAYEAIYKANEKEQHDIVCAAYFLLLRIYFYRGKYEKFIQTRSSFKSYAERINVLDFNGFVDSVDGWFYVKIGHVQQVAPWLMENVFTQKRHVPMRTGREQIIRVEALLATNEYPELSALLNQLEKLFYSRGHLFSYLNVLIRKAIVQYRCGSIEGAQETFCRAYQIAAPNRIIAQFVECGKDMRSLIAALRRGKTCPIPEEWLDMVQKRAAIYAKHQNYMKMAYEENRNIHSEVQLSRREIDVLHSLTRGLTQVEISDMFDISMNTVKSILKSIYEKLGAANKVEAVRIATEKGIV